MDKLHNLHRYRVAADKAQFESVQVDLCKLLQRQVDFEWEEEVVADDGLT